MVLIKRAVRGNRHARPFRFAWSTGGCPIHADLISDCSLFGSVSFFSAPESKLVSMNEWAANKGSQNVNFELWQAPMLARTRAEYTCGDIGAMCLDACRARSLHQSKLVTPPRLYAPGFEASRMFITRGSRGLTWLPETRMLVQRFTVKVVGPLSTHVRHF